jgi:hypothetical protein
MKNWSFSKQFFIFPTWFHHYSKNKNYFFNYYFYKNNEKDLKKNNINKKFLFILSIIDKSSLTKNKKKFLLDYIKIYFNNKIPSDIKKDLLFLQIINLYKYFSFKFKENILNKIRYNRKLNWNEKKRKLDFIEKIIDSSYNAKEKFLVLQNI